MKLIKTKWTKKQVFIFILALIVFITIQPYFVWGITSIIRIVISFVCLYISVRYYSHLSIKNVTIAIFFLFCYAYIFLGGSTYKGFSLIFVLPLFFILLPDDFKIEIFLKLKKIIAIVFFFGLITYLLRFVINLPHFIINPLNSLKIGELYSVYLFDMDIIPTPKPYFDRFMSVFDEPGVVGTISALLISYKKLDLKKFDDSVILIAGILSFSLAFYIIFIISRLYYLNMTHIIITIIFSSILFMVFAQNPIVDALIFSRFKIVDGSWLGDNRHSGYFEKNYSNFVAKGGKDLIFGRGPRAEYFDDYKNVGSSYKFLIYRHGIVGISLFLLFFLYCTLKIAPTKRGVFYLIVFVLLAYQRIQIFSMYNIVFFLGGLHFISKMKIYKNNSNLEPIQ